MLSLVGSPLSLAGASAPGVAMRAGTPAMAVERSASIPFLKKPPALDGSMVGDVGFDPLGISTTIIELGGDLRYVREAELMHGRQAMLATVGFVFPKLFGKLPVDWAKDISLNPLEAQYQIPPVALGQIAISIAIAEGLRSRIVFSNDPDYVVGDHGFGAGMLKGKSEAQVKDMKMKELAHCRLAMVAITGMFFQTAITGSLYPLVDKF